MKKLLIVLLTVAMLFTLPVGAFFTYAADVEEMTEALKAENGNLALGKDVVVNYSAHTGSGFGRQLITDGDLNGNYTGGAGTSWHSGDSTGSNRATWFAIDFGEVTKLDTVVLYPRTNGDVYDCMANAVRIVATDDPTITDINGVAEDKREEYAVGDAWIGEGVKNPDWVPYSPTGTVVYEQFDMDLRTAPAEPITFQFEAVETRYLVVYGLSLFGPWRSWTVAECAVYNRGYVAPTETTVNLAEGKEVIASSSHEDGPWAAAKLTDGDRYNMNEDRTYVNDYGQYVGYHSAADGSLPHDGTGEVTIDINLGAPTAFDTYTIWPSTAKYSSLEDAELFVPGRYDIQISDDGEIFNTVKSVDGEPVSEYAPIVHTLDTPVTATYVRVVFKGITKHIKLSEIEITNSTGASPETPDEEQGKLTAGANLFAAHYQTRANGENAHDMRIVLIANESRFDEIGVATVRVSFELESGAEIYFTATLGGGSNEYELYRTVRAGDDTYVAQDGYVLFGHVVTGIPNDVDYVKLSVVITDNATGTVLLSASTNR